MRKFVFSSQSSPSPYPQRLANCGPASLAPDPPGPHLPPCLHACLFPSFSLFITNTHTHDFHNLLIFLLSTSVYPVAVDLVPICLTNSPQLLQKMLQLVLSFWPRLGICWLHRMLLEMVAFSSAPCSRSAHFHCVPRSACGNR